MTCVYDQRGQAYVVVEMVAQWQIVKRQQVAFPYSIDRIFFAADLRAEHAANWVCLDPEQSVLVPYSHGASSIDHTPPVRIVCIQGISILAEWHGSGQGRC